MTSSVSCGLEARARARRVGVVRVAVGLELPAGLRLAVLGVQAQRPAQERERVHDVGVAARRGLADQDRVLGVGRGRADAGVGRLEELAIELGRVRLAVLVLRLEELRLVGLVPDRPRRHGVAVAAAERGRERAVLRGDRLGVVVLLGLRRPARHRAGDRQRDRDALGLGRGDQPVEVVPLVARIGVRVRRVEARAGGRVRLGRVVAPVDELADVGHAERADLVERDLARGGRKQFTRRFERHGLARRRGSDGGPAQHGDQWQQENSSHVRGRRSGAGGRVGEADPVLPTHRLPGGRGTY